MTVTTETVRVAYTGNGTTTAFAAPFLFLANTDLRVYLSGVLQSSGFTVTGAGVGTGTVTFTTAPASGVAVVIVCRVSPVQNANFVPNDSLPAEVLETQLDRRARFDHFLEAQDARALRVPEHEATLADLPAAVTRAGRVLGFNATTGAPEMAALTSLPVPLVTPFVDGLMRREDKTKLDAFISLKDFGAKGDGVTDDTLAVKAWINALVAPGFDRPAKGYVPAGRYLITENNVLGQWNSIDTTVFKGVFGLNIYGDGMYNTQFVLRNNTADQWYFWDNKKSAGVAENNSLLIFSICDIGFSGTGSGVSHGFRSYGTNNGYPSQGGRFERVQFLNMGWPLICEGVVNDSEYSFFQCRINSTYGLINSSNPQAVNHVVVGTDVELYAVAAFRFTGGGSLTVIGGSFITFQATETFMLELSPPNGVGLASGFAFVGSKTELNAAAAKILKISGRDNPVQVTFDNTYHVTRTGAPSDCIQVGSMGSWNCSFRNCAFSGNDGVLWKNNGTLNHWYASGFTPSLTFDNCRDMSKENVTWETNTLGFTKIINPVQGKPWEGGRLGSVKGASPSAGSQIFSVDGWSAVGRWPNSTDSGAPSISVAVPIGAKIMNIYVEKPVLGGSSATYRLQVVDGAGVEIAVPTWASGDPKSVSGTMSARHVIVLRGLMKDAVDATSATVQVRAVTGSEGDASFLQFDQPGCRLTVEYFAT